MYSSFRACCSVSFWIIQNNITYVYMFHCSLLGESHFGSLLQPSFCPLPLWKMYFGWIWLLLCNGNMSVVLLLSRQVFMPLFCKEVELSSFLTILFFVPVLFDLAFDIFLLGHFCTSFASSRHQQVANCKLVDFITQLLLDFFVLHEYILKILWYISRQLKYTPWIY